MSVADGARLRAARLASSISTGLGGAPASARGSSGSGGAGAFRDDDATGASGVADEEGAAEEDAGEEEEEDLDLQAELRSAGVIAAEAATGDGETSFSFSEERAFSGRRWDGVRGEWVSQD